MEEEERGERGGGVGGGGNKENEEVTLQCSLPLLPCSRVVRHGNCLFSVKKEEKQDENEE